MCKKHLLLIVLSLAPYYANAQQLDTVFIGMATLQDKTTLTYKLKFTDSAGTIKGYSVTDIAGNDETTASISGTINPSKTQIQFKELNITNTKSKGAQSDFCIMQGALKVKKINGVKVLKGHFEGYLNGSTTLCASGKLILISPKDFLKVIGKAQHEEEDSSELHSKENVNSRRYKNKAKTKEDAPTETALVNEETLKPKVEIVKKEPKLNSTIVYEDAPIDEMIEGIIDGIFFNQGHVCCAGSRLLVQESIADDVLRRLVRRVEQLRVGDPMDKNTDVGAINSAEQLSRINELVSYGEQEGATRYSSSCELPKKGYWFAPTVFADVSQSHRIAREEIFGPVLSVLTFRTPEEAITKANNTNYGLACGVWSEKGSRTLWTAERLRAGVVWANTYNKFDPTSPFGGTRESGFGREGGKHGLEAYLNV